MELLGVGLAITLLAWLYEKRNLNAMFPDGPCLTCGLPIHFDLNRTYRWIHVGTRDKFCERTPRIWQAMHFGGGQDGS